MRCINDRWPSQRYLSHPWRRLDNGNHYVSAQATG
jgi:hypothetical protein